MKLEDALTQDTDLRAFVELYKRFGIECKVCNALNQETGKDVFTITLAKGRLYETEYCVFSEKFKGYVGFFTSITFDTKGNFISQGFWE